MLTPSDLKTAGELVLESFAPVVGNNWERLAGVLGWSCRRTLDHIPDALLLYAAHLARGADRQLPPPRNGDRTATVGELLEGVVSAACVLAQVAVAAPSTARAFHPAGMADPSGFLAMGCDEVLVHAHDIACGLSMSFTPPPWLASRVLDRLFPWAPRERDPWLGLLWANGRLGLGDRGRLGADWYWHCAPLEEWDGTIKRRSSPPRW